MEDGRWKMEEKKMEVVETFSTSKGEFVIRYPTMDDLKSFWRYANKLSKEKTFVRFQGEEISLDYEKEYLEGVVRDIKQKKLVQLGVFLPDGTLVGSSSVKQSSLIEKHVGEFAIALDKDYRGVGLGRKLMETVIAEAKKQLTGLEIITLSVWKKNKVAQRLYKSFGFKHFGTLPNGVKTPDGYDDQLFMYLQLSKKG